MRVAGTPWSNQRLWPFGQSHYTNWPMEQSKGTSGLGAGPMAPAWSRRTVPRASSLGLTRLLEIDRKGDLAEPRALGNRLEKRQRQQADHGLSYQSIFATTRRRQYRHGLIDAADEKRLADAICYMCSPRSEATASKNPTNPSIERSSVAP